MACKAPPQGPAEFEAQILLSVMLDVTEGGRTVYFGKHLCPFPASWVMQIDSDICNVPTSMSSILKLSVSSIENVLSNHQDTVHQISIFSNLDMPGEKGALSVTRNQSDP